jgi:dolichol-phosphate mannosyltransferase
VLPKSCIVLPTYNEAENIEAVVRAVRAYGCYVLIVDDASEDGTAVIADRLASQDAGVSVLHRPMKTGLGDAYGDAFSCIVDDYSVIGQMDADLSHNPVDVPRLLAAINDGADVVIGSRYVPGGGVGDWSLLRRSLSSGGNRYARMMLGGTVQDMTGGFRMFTTAALRALEPASCTAAGYAFQVEMVVRAQRRNLDVREVPIVFRDRVRGVSKMNGKIAREAITLITKWGFQRWWKKVRRVRD